MVSCVTFAMSWNNGMIVPSMPMQWMPAGIQQTPKTFKVSVNSFMMCPSQGYTCCLGLLCSVVGVSAQIKQLPLCQYVSRTTYLRHFQMNENQTHTKNCGVTSHEKKSLEVMSVKKYGQRQFQYPTS